MLTLRHDSSYTAPAIAPAKRRVLAHFVGPTTPTPRTRTRTRILIPKLKVAPATHDSNTATTTWSRRRVLAHFVGPTTTTTTTTRARTRIVKLKKPAKPSAPKPSAVPVAPIPIKRRALCIGINYIGTSNELNGCINDQENLVALLRTRGNFADGDIVRMSDNSGNSADSALYPTYRKMWTQLNALRLWASQWPASQPVQLLVSYSGHGTYRPRSTDAGETDHRDEALVPLDFQQRGFITDDTLRLNFISLLPSNVTLLILLDACNSGTAADLRYSYNLRGGGSGGSVAIATANTKYSETACLCVCLSACADNQTAADAWLPDPVSGVYEAQGALTSAFCSLFQPALPLKQLAGNMYSWVVQRGFSQLTQLTSSKPVSDTLCFY